MIPTAEEFAKYQLTVQHVPHFDRTIFKGSQMKEMMIEFAKLHVKAALENAAKYADLHSKYKPQIGEQPDINCNKYIYQNSILNSYPLNQIK